VPELCSCCFDLNTICHRAFNYINRCLNALVVVLICHPFPRIPLAFTQYFSTLELEHIVVAYCIAIVRSELVLIWKTGNVCLACSVSHILCVVHCLCQWQLICWSCNINYCACLSCRCVCSVLHIWINNVMKYVSKTYM